MQAYRYLKDRRTGQPCGPFSPIFKEDFPFSSPHKSELLWRYLDMHKFEDLMKTASIYFARSDRFEDPFEGRFTPGNQMGPSRSDLVFREVYPFLPHDGIASAKSHDVTRRCVFVSCWHRALEETPLMWEAYTHSPDSVAIVATAKSLIRFVGDQRITKSCVKYQPLEHARTELTHLSLFFCKPSQYAFENEFRMVLPLQEGESSFENDTKDCRRVPIRLSKIIRKVVTHPNASKETKAKVAALLACLLPGIKRSDSSLPSI